MKWKVSFITYIYVDAKTEDEALVRAGEQHSEDWENTDVTAEVRE